MSRLSYILIILLVTAISILPRFIVDEPDEGLDIAASNPPSVTEELDGGPVGETDAGDGFDLIPASTTTIVDEDTEPTASGSDILVPSLPAEPGSFPTAEDTATSVDEELGGTDQAALKLETVPFVAQAPFGDWDDPRQQDGCEEASVIMAVAWLRGELITREQGLERILTISDWEADKYDSYHDTSAADTSDRLIAEYYKEEASVVDDVSLPELIATIRRPNTVVIAPMNGRALKNPNFTAPGPERHMVLIIGYDSVKKEFITNDPGTRQGKGYRYGQELFYAAIRDYPTGDHLPIPAAEAKNVIVVER